MAVATYATDLALISDAEDVGDYGHVNITGAGGAGLSDEGDYFIEGTQSVSKAGWVTDTKGIMQDVGGTITVASGDAIFVWAKQNNRNLMDTVAAGGLQVLIGDGLSDYDQFYVDGDDSEGSDLAGWRNYAVDPTQTASDTQGTPTTTDYTGIAWKILGSGTLKGNPNAIDVARHGRELQIIDGQAAAYGTFLAASVDDSASAWGVLTPSLGSFLFHGAFVMGTGAAAVDFRDSARVINVLDDIFLPVGFNEFEIRNASSNVEWTNIIISHLGAGNFPAVLTFDVGTFTGLACQFNNCSTTLFNSAGTCVAIWTECEAVTPDGANLSGSSILVPNISANTSGLIWNVNTDPDGLLDEMEFTKTSGLAHHAIEFGTAIADAADFTLRGCEFGTDFSGTEDGSVGDETFHFLDTTGSITLNLVECGGNFGYRTEGVAVSIITDPVTVTITVTDNASPPVVIEDARVFLEASSGSGPLPFEDSVAIVQSGGTATVTHAAHGLETNKYVVIRGATQNEYNKVAQVTVVDAGEYTYSVDSGVGSPAGGSPIATGVIISGLSNPSGIIADTRTYSGNQPFSGWARKSSAQPFYRSGNITGIISSVDGFTASISLLLDE